MFLQHKQEGNNWYENFFLIHHLDPVFNLFFDIFIVNVCVNCIFKSFPFLQTKK
jgi:hypothetical protein